MCRPVGGAVAARVLIVPWLPWQAASAVTGSFRTGLERSRRLDPPVRSCYTAAAISRIEPASGALRARARNNISAELGSLYRVDLYVEEETYGGTRCQRYRPARDR